MQYEEESTLTFDSRHSCGCADIKQRQVVEDALQAVQEQRDLADKYEELIYTLRADLENTKVMMDAAV